MIILGRNPVQEALKSQFVVNSVSVQADLGAEKLQGIAKLASKKNVPVHMVSKHELNQLTDDGRHQGVIADVNFFTKPLQNDDIEYGKLYLYVREAQDMHNLGAVIRTADAAGLGGVIVAPKQTITETVGRTSMGAMFHVPIYEASLFPVMKQFKQLDLPVFAIELAGETSLLEANLGQGMLIVGGEDYSVSGEVAAQCDTVITIPQFGKVNSLNMSVAAALAMYRHVETR